MNAEHSRNDALGQVWTPPQIAERMVEMLRKNMGKGQVNVLDPACGPGTFAKAAKRLGWTNAYFHSIDIDSRFVKYNENLAENNEILSSVYEQNFINHEPDSLYDAAILNPPYIRHEKISSEEKQILADSIHMDTGYRISGRSNLMIYFLVRSILLTKANGYISAIIYDALRQTKYGKSAFELINSLAEIVHEEFIHAPFANVAVDAHLLLLRRRRQPLPIPINMESEPTKAGFCKLEQLVDIRRGASFTPRNARVSKTRSVDHPDATIVKALSVNTIIARSNYWTDQNLITKIDNFKAPIIFNYYIRNNAKFVFNRDNLVAADNYYLLTPKLDRWVRAQWLLLNSQGYLDPILERARSQGSGLKKLQTYELKGAEVPDWRLLTESAWKQLEYYASQLIEEPTINDDIVKVKARVQEIVKSERLKHERVW